MKTKAYKKPNPSGYILVTMLVLTAVIGVALASYLKLTHTQNQFTARSQVWNNCIPLIEAGIEDALGQLNLSGNSNLAASGWTGTSTSFWKERELGDGYYRVTVNTTNILFPVVMSTGNLPAPPALSYSQQTMMGAAFVPNPKIKYMSRTVRVVLQKQPALTKGLVAKDGINLGGNQCLVDSFDSSVGMYTAATAGDKGDVAINSDVYGVAGIGNADIKGHLYVGPKAKVNIGPNGHVGSLNWHATQKGGIEPGWLRRDMNIDLPDIVAPWTGGALTPDSNGGFKYIVGTGNYELTSMNLDAKTKMQVNGKAVLYVKGDVTIAGDIKYEDDNSSLTIYCGGKQISLSGTYDKKDIAANLMVFGLPSVKTMGATGVAAVLYAPSASMTLNGNSQFYGSCVAKSVSMNGTTAFHYDEALAKEAIYRQYVISSWNEI